MEFNLLPNYYIYNCDFFDWGRQYALFHFKKGHKGKGLWVTGRMTWLMEHTGEGRNNLSHEADEVTEGFSSWLNLDLCRWRGYQKT